MASSRALSLSLTLIALAHAMDERVAFEDDASPEQRPEWTRSARASPSEFIRLTFLLEQSGLGVKRLERVLEQVSDPSSPEYGQHWSNDAIHALVSPAPESLRAVHEYLALHGIEALPATPNADMLFASVPIGLAERLLSCSYYEYVHNTGATALRTSNYSLPHSLLGHVAAVAPTVILPSIRRPRPTQYTAAFEPNAVGRPHSLWNSPRSLREEYTVGAATGTASTSHKGRLNRQAVTAFEGQRYNPKDLQAFYSTFLNASRLGYPLSHPTPKLVGNGSAAFPIGGVEAMLDLETIIALGNNIETEFWGFKGRGGADDPFLYWLQTLANTADADAPYVFSTSYGDDEYQVSRSYAERLHTEFMKAGVRGISLLFASGDSGAAGATGCHPRGKYTPEWPASSPYVTAVGGSFSWANFAKEEGIGLSSGGLSVRYPRPKWQEAVVNGYLKSLPTANTKRIVNPNGRAFPDVAAEAIDVVTVVYGLPLPVGGTSAASPIFAGIISLLNDRRLRAGKPSLGFLNPWLYSNASNALNDITNGEGFGCETGPGFPAAKGWDAVTGLGSPNFEQLVRVL